MRRLAVATAFVALAAWTKPKTIAVEACKGWDHGRGRRCNVVGSTHAAKLRRPCAVTSAVLHARKQISLFIAAVLGAVLVALRAAVAVHV